MDNIDFEAIKNAVNARVSNQDMDNSGMHDVVKQHILPIVDRYLKDPVLRKEINDKLKIYSTEKYADVNKISNDSNSSNGIYNVDNTYYKEETKNYIKQSVGEHETYVWDGKFYLNRAIGDQQVEAFYDGKMVGELINYYESDNLYIEAQGTISGSDGSDILIGGSVTGQTDYKGYAGDNIVRKAGSVQNGDDIVIASVATEFSGDNLVFANNIQGGSGNDILISQNGNIQINHENKQTENKSIALLLGNGRIYSSGNQNTILTCGEGSGAFIYGTGGDKIILGDNRTVFLISGLDGFNTYGSSETDGSPDYDFYKNKASFNALRNEIYSGSGELTGYLSSGDYIDASKGRSILYGAENNEIILGDSSVVHSKGNSNITIKGSSNSIYLGINDQYNLEFSAYNDLYSAGYETDESISGDYEIKGSGNTIHLGTSQYNIKASGNVSKITFDKENINQNTITVAEAGETYIGVSKLNSLTINNSNPIRLSGINTSELPTFIEILDIHSESKVSIGNLIANNIQLNSLDDISLVYSNINEIDITLGKDIVLETSDIDKLTITSDEDNTEQSVKIMGSTIRDLSIISKKKLNILLQSNSSLVNILNANVSLSSEINDFTLEGELSGYNTNQNNVNLLNVKGKISNATLSNIQNFSFKQDDNSEKSTFTLKNSIINSESISGATNANINLINTPISQIDLVGESYSISLDEKSPTSLININSKNEILLNGGVNSSSDLNLVSSSTILKATQVSDYNVNFSESNTVSISSANTLEFDSGQNILNKIFLPEVNKLKLSSGIYEFTGPIKTNELSIDVNKVQISENNDYYINDLPNIVLNSDTEVKIMFKDAKYNINNFKTSNVKNSINVAGKVYNEQQVMSLLFRLSNDLENSYIILDENKSSYYINGQLDGEELPIDEKIIGTDGNDTLTGNTNGNSYFYAGKGMDIINIVGGNNIINYSVGDGYKVIVNPNNIQVGIVIEGVVDRSLLTYVQTDPKTLHVSYNNDLLFTWNNAAYCYLQFSGTTDFVYGSSILNNIPPINPTEPTNPENPNPPTGPTNPTEPSNPTTPTNPTNPTNPPANVYSGTAGNDYQTLSENVAYTINSSAGNDIYEFTIGNGNNNVLNYSIGSGLTTIKTSGNNFVFLNIKFSNIDKSLLKFDIVKNQFGSESELTILYNNVAITKINNYINVSLLINITNNGESITMNNSDIEASLYSINGTDGDDNLIGNTTNSIFNPGKGTDLINIVGGSNRINYKAGDGYKTVINPTFSYVVVAFDSSIDKTLITYELGDNNSLNVKYNGELIFTLKQPNASGLQFSDYSIVNGYEILQGLSTINGTDADEIIEGNANGPSIINPKKGTDIINLVGGQNTINYTIGDGYKTINSTELYYQININGEVDNLLLSYVKNGDEAIDVKYNDEIIFSISDPYSATIALTSTNQYIYLSQVYDELSAIQGTDGDDILYGAENGSYIIGKKGNDEINLVGGYNTIGYAIGDGHDTIKGEYSNMIRLSGVVDRELLTFEKVDTHMNVYYDTEVILTIEYPYMSNIQIEETYEFINLSDYMTDE